ncbi:MAG: iron ABC transporter permease [Clostridia bacterium]|nr:iron ABC transporter permease [Clostridia bacterium]
MTNKQSKPKLLANNLKSYLSKPANIITIVFFVILVLTVVLPLFTLLIGSFQINNIFERNAINRVLGTDYKKGDFTLYSWKEMLFDSEEQYAWLKFWKPMLESMGMALIACAIAVIGGGVVAWFVTRSNIPCKKIISTIFVFPYIMPSWSIAIFWENFFKNNAIEACRQQVGMLQGLTGICTPEWMVYGFFPCAMCLGIHYAPFAYILIGGILRNMDANLEEAATVLKASRGKILWRVTLPIVAPALISTVLLVFSSSISSYTVPAFLNKNGSFISISVQMKSLLQGNSMSTVGQGYVVAIILMLFSIAILTLNNWFTGKRKSFTTVTGKSGQVSLVKLGAARIPIAIILMIIVVFFAIVPMISFALESLYEVPGDMSSLTLKYWISSEHVEGSTKGDTIGILLSGTMWKAMGRSLLLSVIVAFVAGTFGILIGYAVARKRSSKLATWVSNLAFFPYLIPSMCFGAVYLALSLSPGFNWLQNSTTTLFILLILVGSVKFMPFASRTGTNAMLQLSGEIEEAAIMMNVPWWKRMTHVLFPIQKSSFMSGYLLPFISCMRELSLFVLLTQSHETLITTLLQEYSRTGLTQVSNAINLLIVVVVLVIQFVVNKLTGASLDKGIGG